MNGQLINFLPEHVPPGRPDWRSAALMSTGHA
jgi:hypothetical protein